MPKANKKGVLVLPVKFEPQNADHFDEDVYAQKLFNEKLLCTFPS